MGDGQQNDFVLLHSHPEFGRVGVGTVLAVGFDDCPEYRGYVRQFVFFDRSEGWEVGPEHSATSWDVDGHGGRYEARGAAYLSDGTLVVMDGVAESLGLRALYQGEFQRFARFTARQGTTRGPLIQADDSIVLIFQPEDSERFAVYLYPGVPDVAPEAPEKLSAFTEVSLPDGLDPGELRAFRDDAHELVFVAPDQRTYRLQGTDLIELACD